MHVRLEGTKAEIRAVVPRLIPVLDVQEISDFYKNRGTSSPWRIYLTVTAPTGSPLVQASAERTGRAWAQLQKFEQEVTRDAERTWGPA